MSNPKIITIDNLSLQEFDSEAELIPLLTPEDEEEINNEKLPESLAILPLRNTVLFPGVVIPITAGRDKSIKLINDANTAGKDIGVVSQKNEDVEDPNENDLHSIGTVAKILRVLKMPDGNITVILQGKKRFEIDKVISETPYLTATVKNITESQPAKKDKEFDGLYYWIYRINKVGTTADRSTLTQGEFRFNSTDNLFRGYSTAPVSFAGVYSANKLTNVLAHPTNNTLQFTTNSATNMTIGSGGLTVNSMSVDNNLTFATNIISTATTNADLYLTPNGIGEVIMDDISLYSNEITNLNSANALILQNTGSGYVKFSGTGGLAIPAGPTVIDTSGVGVGDLRYNTTLSITEVFNGVDYVGLSAASATLTGPEVEEITNLWALVLG